ncbi:glycosyltransferase [Terasakiella pusilla]|uniref:glycosyltransferase n=1 Tax=Terasakiella pusilla TaxID=64973 RepID=UPI003AA9A925
MTESGSGFSVLMSVYKNDIPEDFLLAVKSVQEQTRKPSQLVLVVDGPISPALKDAVKSVRSTDVTNVTVEWLPHNMGLAAALNIGLKLCQYDLVARMDSDDYSVPDRFEYQVNLMRARPDVGLTYGWAKEFYKTPEECVRIKKSPASMEGVRKSLQYRNVLCHPSVMFRKKEVLKIGGYCETVGLVEDWDLYLRLLQNGVVFLGLERTLLCIRVSEQQVLRRGGWAYVKNELRFRYAHFKAGNIAPGPFALTILPTIIFRLVPPSLKKNLYNAVREKI